MGHQITFHALPDDAEQFFRSLSAKHHVFGTPWTSDNGAVVRSERPALERCSLALWEERLGGKKERKLIKRDDGLIVYEFDRENSVLEYRSSLLTVHGTLPALLQGRLYSFTNEMRPETSGIFQTARQWIRRNFERCPLKLLGGYIGPTAMNWYRDGGILLPMFNPPATAAWEEFIDSQHGPQTVSS